MSGQNESEPTPVDLMIVDTLLVTMDAERRVIREAAIAVDGDLIVAVGKSKDLKRRYQAKDTIDGSRFVITPGLVNTHAHVTGEPLTKGLVPDASGFREAALHWMMPIHMAASAADEGLASRYAALEMLRTGTTCLLEAGTIRFLDAVVEALSDSGIRARVGQWAWDFLPEDQSYPASATDEAVALLEAELDRYPAAGGNRIAAWPILIGHMTASDALWRAAKELADSRGVGVAAHVSPIASEPEWYLSRHGRRPIEHLAELGVLDANLVLTHAVHVDAREVKLLAGARASVSHCPTAALKCAFGATAAGRLPEMHAQDVNIALGTEGNNTSNSHDLMRATSLVAGLFKDSRVDATLFPAEEAFACATINGARALGLSERIGSLEPGKKADFVAHDTWRPEWRPLFNVANQLVWSADGRSVHSVWVDGVRVVDNYRCTTLDEDRLYAEVQAAGEALVARARLPIRSQWPVV